MEINTWYTQSKCKPAAVYIIIALILIAISTIIFIWTYGINQNSLMILASALFFNIVCLIILYLVLTGLCTVNETAAWVVAIIIIILIICSMFAQGTLLSVDPTKIINMPNGNTIIRT